jgi:hypothetical protein
MYVIGLMIGLLSCRRRRPGKSKPPSLLSLCLGVVGKNLQDIIAHLSDISIAFPPHIKVSFSLYFFTPPKNSQICRLSCPSLC